MKKSLIGVFLLYFLVASAQDRFFPPLVEGGDFIIDGYLNEGFGPRLQLFRLI